MPNGLIFPRNDRGLERKFFDVHAATQSPLAHEALQRIAALYAVEAPIRGQTAEVRLNLRQTQSVPLFTGLKAWLEQTQARVPGKSELAVAIRYALSRWNALTLVCDRLGIVGPVPPLSIAENGKPEVRHSSSPGHPQVPARGVPGR
jgi:hypothetical protein